MASFSAQVAQFFPAGTSVGAYPRSQWSTGAPPTRGTAPPGSPVSTSAVASDGTVTFANLTAKTVYVMGAQVGGTWTFVSFTAGADADQGTRLGDASTTTLALTLTAAFQAVLSKTVTVGTKPIRVVGVVPSTAITGGTGRIQVNLVDETGTQVQFVETQPIASGNQGGSVVLVWVPTSQPSAGPHTYTLQARYVGATGGTVSSGATFPAQLVIESA